MPKTKETCPGCGGAPHAVSLPKRHAECKTCGGRIRSYTTATLPPVTSWAHLHQADWIDNPHPAEPKEVAA